MAKLKKPIIFIILVMIVLMLNKLLNLSQYFSNMDYIKETLENNFALALLIYIVVTAVACVILALPGITFAVIAGLVFGPIWGSLACLIGTTLGASLAFLVGRYFLKDSIKPMLEKNRILKKLLFSNNKKNDLMLLMITRLVPIFPYNIQNFAYGITDIGFWKYTVLTFIFMIPGVSIYTIGSAGLVANDDKMVYFIVAGALLAVVSFIGFLIQKKYLTKKECVILFTRIPSIDKGKTRLKTHLSGLECETLQEKFIQDTYLLCQETSKDVIISFGDEGGVDKLKAIIKQDAIYVPQKGADLSEKMANAFKDVFDRGYERAVLIGSDIPHMGKGNLKDAFEKLDNSHVVISPTLDGGYYLIGLNNMEGYKELFNVEGYGGGDVLTFTVDKIKAMNLKLSFGEENFDIDVWKDLKKLGDFLDKHKDICSKSREYVKFLLESEDNENINNNTNI